MKMHIILGISICILATVLAAVGVYIAFTGGLDGTENDSTTATPSDNAPTTPAQKYFQVTSPNAWAIVCNSENGQFSYLMHDGRISYSDFSTRAAAEEARDHMKKWCAEYDPERIKRENEKERAKEETEQVARQTKFIPCQP